MQKEKSPKLSKGKNKSALTNKGNGCPPGMVKDKDGNCVKEGGPQ